MSDRCKELVYQAGMFRPSRCARAAIRDGYCKQHHPDSVQARREQSEKTYQARMEKDPLRICHRQLLEVTAQRDELLAMLKELVKQPDVRSTLLGDEAEILIEKAEQS